MEFDNADEQLFFAIAFIDQPGSDRTEMEAALKAAITDGADLNALNDDGETPLTAAVEGGMGSPTAVEILLSSGANPNTSNSDGWSPWAICQERLADRVVEANMQKIRRLLEAAGVDSSDSDKLKLRQALLDGDLDQARTLMDAGVDCTGKTVDAAGNAACGQNIDALKLVLEAGADPNGVAGADESPLHTAAELPSVEIAALLLDAGADPERFDFAGRTALIIAAEEGNRAMAECLLDGGANVMQASKDDDRHTAAFAARASGHKALATWLTEKMTVKPEQPLEKFAGVLDAGTNGINYDVTTHDVIEKLTTWDAAYSIDCTNIAADRLTVAFGTLPEDLAKLAKDIYEFCPDVIDQGFGCMDDMVEMMAQSGQELPAEQLALIDGINFDDEDFGLQILKRVLLREKTVALWWD